MRPFPSRRPLLLILLTLTASAALLVCGWRFLQQKHEQERERSEVRREQAADRIVSELEKALRTTEEALRDRDAVRAAAATPDSIAVIMDGGTVEALPYGRLLYHPVAAPGFPSSDADALIRTADKQRRSGAHESALESYQKAMRMAWTATGDVPTELFARAARCDLLAEMGRIRDLRIEALHLRELLLEGRWRITRPRFEVYLKSATNWARAGEPPAADRLALSQAVERLYVAQPLRVVTSVAPGLKPSPTDNSGLKPWPTDDTGGSRSTMTVGGVQYIVLLQTAGTRRTTLVAGPMFVENVWKAHVRPLVERSGVRVELVDGTEQESVATGISRRDARRTGLPWTILVEDDVRTVRRASRVRVRGQRNGDSPIRRKESGIYSAPARSISPLISSASIDSCSSSICAIISTPLRFRSMIHRAWS